MGLGLTGRLRAYRLFWSVAVGILVLDQATKAWVAAAIPFGTYDAGRGPGGASPVVVIPDFFQLVHIGNEGAAWGILSGYRFLLVLVAVVALAAIYFYRGSLELKRTPMQACFGLIVGGILGNLLDRLLYGHVVDFLDVRLPAIPFLGFDSYRWPAFNVADSGISCGVVAYIVLSFFDSGGARNRSGGKSAEASDGADS